MIRTPPTHGATLVLPEPGAMAAAAEANHDALDRANTPLLKTTLAACRKKTRQALCGTDDALVIVTGHQPGFIHPGVWAKHVVAMRAAAALDGIAINLVVDQDAPQTTTLPLPSVTGDGVTLESVPYARPPAGCAYEDMGRQTLEDIRQFEDAIRAVTGRRYQSSQMPTFFRGVRDATTDAHDWVDQAVGGRRAVEAALGVVVDDCRVSRAGFGPLWVDLILHARPFAAAYNQALQDYRHKHGVRGSQRPMPDLLLADERCETAFWAYRHGEPRQRLFVARDGDDIHLSAGKSRIARLSASTLETGDGPWAALQSANGWRIRPRALTLTLWARLLLADLFIHGIGGAKYAEINDAIITGFYRLAPPRIGCVSATLQLDLPTKTVTPEEIRRLTADLRDLSHNPQRHIPLDARLRGWTERRAEAVRVATEIRQRTPHDHAARRAAFEEIRRLNALLLAEVPDTRALLERQLAEANRFLRQRRIAESREYFFGLFNRSRLDTLLAALPAERAFRV